MQMEIVREGSDGKVVVELGRDRMENRWTDLAAMRLEGVLKHPMFCKPHHRNDSIVDAMIYLGILGGDIGDVLKSCCMADWIDMYDYREGVDKAYVVDEYIDDWLAGGDEDAFRYELGFLAHN